MSIILSELRDTGIARSKSARRLADYVLQQPQEVTTMTIAALATAVSVSEPTVNRFCTGMGFKGFPDFKLRLAAELALNNAAVAPEIDESDSCAGMIAKIFESARARLTATLQQLDAAIVDEAAHCLANARAISVCGQGASPSVALDAQHKLLRFRVPVVMHPDNLNQRLQASGMSHQDCLLVISYTGRTVPVIEVADLAKKTGATIIGVTAAKSPLARRCDLILPVAPGENTEVYTPMSSRISQLVVIDAIIARMALLQAGDFSHHLEQIKRGLATTRSGGRS